MKIKSKAMVAGRWIEFEFEGSLEEISELPNNIDKIKDALIELVS